ncbi:MAG: DUF1009 domain-containing protein, partial [Deltaproteobacteria bacterium]|nr:DUF1009 domain-containing protein [Deltaproteobacteria bacterium]
MTRKIGIISGSGRFPLIFSEAARREGFEVIAIAHKGETRPELAETVDKIFWLKLGQLGK